MNQMSIKSKFPKFFVGMVYTLPPRHGDADLE